MKALVVYYSRHGHTRMIGEKIARIMKADVEEIIDLTDRSKVISWAESAYHPDIRKPTDIKKPKKDPMDYDLVIIGTPIWDGVTPPVRKYLESFDKWPNIAFFATFGASEGDAFETMQKMTKLPKAVLGLQDRELILGEDEKKVKKFCDMLKN